MAYVYILQGKGRKYYVGSTIDLRRRLKHHRGGFTPSTKRLGTVELVFSQYYPSLAEARQIEQRLKRMKRRDYVEKIVKEGEIQMRV